MNDIHLREWSNEKSDNKVCDYYDSIKHNFGFEGYLIELGYKSRCIVTQFRSRSNFLPAHVTKLYDVNIDEITCPFCDSFPCDEMHLIRDCPFFETFRCRLVNVNLHANLYSNLNNLKKCIPFMEFIMSECKDILTCH